MFNSSVLDVAIGVIFGFLAVSLITSAIVEAINSMFGLRAASLLTGVKTLVNDPGFIGLAKELYKHAAINPRGFSPSDAATAAAAGDARASQRAAVAAPLKNKPAYIDPGQFAGALLDITGLSAAAGAGAVPGAGAVAAFKSALADNVHAVANPQIRQLLEGIVDRTAGDMALLRHEVASWFDGAMDRVGGSFKRQTQVFSFFIAFAIAAMMNVDTIHLATSLWEHPALVESLKIPQAVKPDIAPPGPGPAQLAPLVAPAVDITSVLNRSLPVGWAPGHFLQAYRPDPTASDAESWMYFWTFKDGIAFFVGWLATAIATLFGAPFWFDVLQKIVRLKGSGPSPQEKCNGTAASG